MDPNTISIEAGCIYRGNNIWEYRYGDNEGYHSVQFASDIAPKIGDEIVNGFLVIRTTPKINQDHSKWIPQHEETWPINRSFD